MKSRRQDKRLLMAPSLIKMSRHLDRLPLSFWCSLFLLLLSSCLSTASATSFFKKSIQNDQQPFLGVQAPQGRLRRATPEDTKAIANIVDEANWKDPIFTYTHPEREKYREEHKRCNELVFTRLLREPHLIGEVVEMESVDDSSVVIPVSMALWAFPGYFDEPESMMIHTQNIMLGTFGELA